MNIFNLLEQARLGMRLTPAQRGFLRLFSNSLILAVIVAFGAIIAAMTAGKTLHDVITVSVTSFGFTIISAVAHYYTSHNQAGLGTTISEIEQKMEKDTGVTVPQIPDDAFPQQKTGN